MDSQHITAREGFAIETTLRSPITFEQARLAHGHGFWTTMDYVSVGSVEESLRRIAERSYRGGHSASEKLVADIYTVEGTQPDRLPPLNKTPSVRDR